MANLEANGRQQSFFAGQDYRNQLINQMLGERQSYFGNDVNLGQQQANNASQMGLQAGEFNAGNNLSSQEFNNNYALSQAGMAGGFQNQLYNQQLNYDQAKAQNMGNLFGGGIGTLFGLGNMAKGSFGGGGGGAGGGGNGGGGSYSPISFGGGGGESGLYSMANDMGNFMDF